MSADLAGAVLDASALLALVREERGADRVERCIWHGALISAINWAEILSDLAENGEPVEMSGQRVRRVVEKLGTLKLISFDEAQAQQAARLRVPAQSLGLSLADRACLALGRIYRLPVLTTDRAWRSLRLSIRIEVIR